jgi:hypothetical protein
MVINKDDGANYLASAGRSRQTSRRQTIHQFRKRNSSPEPLFKTLQPTPAAEVDKGLRSIGADYQ